MIGAIKDSDVVQHFGQENSLTYVWDVGTLSWIKSTGSGGGGGGAVTVADGADVAEGTTTDPAWVSGAGTVISILKKIAAGGAGLTDTQLRASPVPISGTVTANAGTNLNTSLLALESGGNLAAIKADVDKIPAQGQALAAASMPVVLTAIQQTALTPPAAITGFALEAGHLATIDSHIPALGQALAAASIPVILPAATITTLTPPTTVALGAGAAVIGHVINDASSAVIGHVIADTGSTTAVTGNVTAVQTTGTNLHVVLDTTSTTAVTQATGTNLHTVVDSGTLTAVTAITNALPAGTNVIGHVIVDTTSTTAVTQATAANLNATVTQLALTKGTQGATGVSTQDLKDAGRNQTNWFMPLPIVTTVAEVMMTMTGYHTGLGVTPTVSPTVVTAAKTYRIQSITVTYQGIATAGTARVTLRANLSGAGVIGSPLVWEQNFGTVAAAVGIASTYVIPFPDGMEFPAGTGIAVGIQGFSSATPPVGAIVGLCQVWIQGYEY